MGCKKIIKIILALLMYFFVIANIKISKAESIQNGIYYIKSMIDEQYVLDITNLSKDNNANVEIWRNNKGENQKFEIKSVGNGYFTISNINSGKYLDVEYALKDAGTNVIQYTYNDGDNQKWLIKSTKDGYYNIISKCNDLCLDVANNEIKDGTNIIVWNNHGGNNQKFKLELYNPPKLVEPKTVNIEEGCYSIIPASSNKYRLDVENSSSYNCANILLWADNNQNNQKFMIKYVGNNYYTIQCAQSAKYVDVESSSKKAGANVLQYSYNGGDNQQWMFKDAGNGYFSIVSKCNGMYVDVERGIMTNGTNIIMWPYNAGENQKFKLEKTELSIKDTGRSAEFKRAHPEIKVGIDVSKYNGDIDWEAVKNDGIDYVMVRAGFRGYGEAGTLNEDPTFKRNVTGARKAGLDVGVYFFSQAKNEEEGIKEAEYTISLIKKYDINYPVAFDTEYSSSPTQTGRADNISVEERTAATKGFCKTIKENGYKCLIYANNWWLMEQLDLSQLTEYKIWLANYTGATQENPLAKPSSYKGEYVMWQYTSTGAVNGIDGNTDCNIYYYLEDNQ